MVTIDNSKRRKSVQAKPSEGIDLRTEKSDRRQKEETLGKERPISPTAMLLRENTNCRLVGNRRINNSIEGVYEERHEKVFYDAIKFWNDKEGVKRITKSEMEYVKQWMNERIYFLSTRNKIT